VRAWEKRSQMKMTVTALIPAWPGGVWSSSRTAAWYLRPPRPPEQARLYGQGIVAIAAIYVWGIAFAGREKLEQWPFSGLSDRLTRGEAVRAPPLPALPSSTATPSSIIAPVSAPVRGASALVARRDTGTHPKSRIKACRTKLA
jgi:hypothetical protein